MGVGFILRCLEGSECCCGFFSFAVLSGICNGILQFLFSRFERELEALRKELAEATAHTSSTTTTSTNSGSSNIDSSKSASGANVKTGEAGSSGSGSSEDANAHVASDVASDMASDIDTDGDTLVKLGPSLRRARVHDDQYGEQEGHGEGGERDGEKVMGVGLDITGTTGFGEGLEGESRKDR